MRVLHVVATGQRRGAELFASDLVASLDRLGVEQSVAVLRAGPPAVPFQAPVSMLGADGRPLPGLRMHLGAVRALRALVRARRPDLLQAHGGEPLKYGLAAAGGVPVVYRRIGSTAGWLSSSPRRLLYGRLIRRAAKVVAVSEATGRETAEAFRLPPGQVVTIPNGVDPGRVAPGRGRAATRAALGMAPDATAILSLGALTWEKDPVGHLETSAPLLARHPGAVHLFAGDGPLREALADAAGSHGLDGRVLLLGSRDDVGDLLAASDLMLFASRTEGMPASVIEAGMAGVPVAGTALAGVPEVVVDGATGLLAAPGDGDGLRAALDRLLGDGQLRAAMGQAARARCRDRFGIGVVAGAYLALYEELAGGGMRGVLIVIKGLGRGGAEQLLASSAPYLDTERFRYRFAYLLPWKDSLVPELETAGLPVDCLDGAKGLGWVGRLRGLVRREDIDLVHVHSPVAAAAARAALGRRARIVYTEHNVWSRYHPATYAANLATFPRNDHVFAVSEEVRSSVRYPRPLRVLPMPPTETLYHGLDQAAVAGWGGADGVRAEFGIPQHAPVVGNVANFKAAKDHPTLLRAAARVRQRLPEVRFLLIGQGPLEPASRRLAADLGLDGTVLFTGFRTDAHRLLASLDVFTLSSTYEGLPIALIEAMALGRPAVVTRVGGVPEVLRDGVQGLLVPPRDPEALADGLLRLLGDPELRARMGAAGRERAAHFDIRKAVRRMEQVYAQLLA